MIRREFIALAGSAAVGWPLAALGQQKATPVIGYLSFASPGPFAPLVAALRQGLSETDYVAGQNVAMGRQQRPARSGHRSPQRRTPLERNGFERSVPR
jgi:hypothetical protein